jgi:hypothetical protein
MINLFRRIAPAALVTSLAFAVPHSLPAQRPETITIDFLARDDDGKPVLGLTPADISLKIGGREISIRDLQLIEASGDASTRQPSPQPSALPAPFGETTAASGTPAPARNVLLLIDEGTLFGLEKIVNVAVKELLGSLTPRDRVGLVTTRPGGASVPLTTNHQAVMTAVEGLTLGRGNSFLCVGALLGQVSGIAQTLPSGRATTLALVSRGSGTGNPVFQGGGGLSGAGNCQFRREHLPPVEAAVAAAQINYHVFHVGGAGNSPSLDNFAGSTGAESSVLSWSDASALARAVQSASTFYRATIDTPPPGRGDHQRTELRSTRPGVKLQGPLYLANALPPPRALDATSLLRGEVTRADLPIRVTAFASRNAGTLPVKLVIAVEPVTPGAPLLSAVVSVVSAEGEVSGQWTARRADLERSPLVTAVPVAPGAYRVRAAVTDEAGRGGMAEYRVSAVLDKGTVVTISDMALGIATQTGFTPRLVFSDEPEATAYLEVYDAPPNATLSVVFELASSPDGPALGSFAGRVSPNQGTHMAIGALPLAQVPPGDTLVRARIRVDGQEAAVVSRTLRKSGG